MKPVNIPYADFKVAADEGVGVIAHIVHGTEYAVFTGNREAMFDAWATGADKTDFDSTYLADSTAVANADQARGLMLGLDEERISKRPDGTQRTSLQRFSRKFVQQPQWVGCGDDIPNGTINDNVGNRLEATRSTAGNTNLSWQLTEPVEFVGGLVYIVNGEFGDWVRYEITAPTSSGAETAVTAGTGEYEKVAVGGGLNMYALGGVEDWDLDLAAKLNANVKTTDVVPVPARNAKNKPNGWFDYNRRTGVVTNNPTQKGRYNLFDASILLQRPVAYAPAHGTERELPFHLTEEEPRLLLPHWTHEMRWHSNRTASKELSVGLLLSREHTHGGPWV